MILQLTIKATLVLVTVAVGVLVLRRSSAATRHLAQVAGLVGVLALPAIVAGAPHWDLPFLAPDADSSPSASTAPTRSAPDWNLGTSRETATPAPGAIRDGAPARHGKTAPVTRLADPVELAALSPTARG